VTGVSEAVMGFANQDQSIDLGGVCGDKSLIGKS